MMQERWWNYDYWKARSTLPGVVTALVSGQAGLLVAPVAAPATDMAAAVQRMRERAERHSRPSGR